MRQLIALGHLHAEGEFNTLELTESSRAVLRGDVPLLLRQPEERVKRSRSTRAGSSARGAGRTMLSLDVEEQARFEALKAWRADVAREHNLPAYLVFHDATLAEMAQLVPESLDAMAKIGGVGAKKLDVYGRAILKMLHG